MAEFRKGDQFNLEVYGAPHLDFLESERLPLPGAALQLRFRRTSKNCAIESEGTRLAAGIKEVE